MSDQTDAFGNPLPGGQQPPPAPAGVPQPVPGGPGPIPPAPGMPGDPVPGDRPRALVPAILFTVLGFICCPIVGSVAGIIFASRLRDSPQHRSLATWLLVINVALIGFYILVLATGSWTTDENGVEFRTD